MGNSTFSCAYSMAIDPLGNVFVAGSKNDTDWWIKKFSATGIEDPNWDKVFTGGLTGAYAHSIAFFNDRFYLRCCRAGPDCHDSICL